MEDNKGLDQVLELTEEQLAQLTSELNEEVEETEKGSNIPFDVNVISSMEEFTIPNDEEYDKGVKDVSRYIGQFHALINNGIDSETAALVMSWIREERMVTDNNKAQIDIVKNQKVAIDKERI